MPGWQSSQNDFPTLFENLPEEQKVQVMEAETLLNFPNSQGEQYEELGEDEYLPGTQSVQTLVIEELNFPAGQVLQNADPDVFVA